MAEQIDRNAEYAIGWAFRRDYCGQREACQNEWQRQGWDEAKANEAPEVGNRLWAYQWGATDAMNDETFFPEQLGAWLRSDYAEGFLSVKAEDPSAVLWMAAFLRRQDEEERYMEWRRLDSEKVRA